MATKAEIEKAQIKVKIWKAESRNEKSKQKTES
jgi:hypothetical protein